MRERYMQAMHSAKTISFLLLIIICLLMLPRRAENDNIIQGLSIPPRDLNESDSMRNVRDISDLVWSIAKLERVECSVIGFDGRRSTQPNYVRMLATTVDTNKLAKLTDHPCAIVKLFSFEALIEKKYSQIRQIFERHIFDQQTYKYLCGCTGEDIPINVSFFRSLYPYLTKAQADSYRNKILNRHMWYHNLFSESGL